MPLDPCQLTPAASLNRVLLSVGRDTPPGDEKQVTAQSLLSAAALRELIMTIGGPLGLAGAHDINLADSLNACLGSPDEATRMTAERIAVCYGRRLGHVLTTLHDGDASSRAHRPEWDDSYWEHWAKVRRVYLGGGLARGRLGELAAATAGTMLGRSSSGTCPVTVAAHPDLLPLIGAARSMTDAAGPALVLDLGHTAVKYALASYQDGALRALSEPMSVRAPAPDGSLDAAAGALGIATALADVTSSAFADVSRHQTPGGKIVAAIAAYLDGGQPLPTPSGNYAPLRSIAADLSQWLSQQVSRRLERPVTITLLHDGSSAARALPVNRGAAVVMLGTALGVGYSCPGVVLRPISRGFRVHGR